MQRCLPELLIRDSVLLTCCVPKGLHTASSLPAAMRGLYVYVRMAGEPWIASSLT